MTQEPDSPPRLEYKQPYVWLATWFGCGLIRPAPGTWGTIGALPVGVIILSSTGLLGLLAATLLITIVGWWASNRFEKATGMHDPSMIVIDEVAGMWLAMMFTTGSALSLLFAFIFFRLFDITKPWPVSWGDNKQGATGVMLDDLIAGLMAGFVNLFITGAIIHAGAG